MKTDYLAAGANWVFDKFASPSWWSRGISLLVLVGLVTLFVLFFPGLRSLRERYVDLPDLYRGNAFTVTLVVVLLAVIIGLYLALKKAAIQNEADKLALELEDMRQQARLANERWDHLLSVESRGKLWQRECVIPTPPFVAKTQRTTRFLTVLNLKGGVGKTSLAANLAAAFGLDKKPLRVLLVDIDFQGTLGEASVDRQLIDLQKQHDGCVGQLLSKATPDPSLVSRLAVPMNRVERAKVILSNEALDAEEFQFQARFFVDQREDPRYRFLSHFHCPEVIGAFDLVIFDCPPRVTVSVVNAVFCSDHVLIPTRLDPGSMDAVPRTVSWLKRFGPLCPADVIGVVASHVRKIKGRPMKADQESYDELRELVKLHCGGDVLFKEVVSASPLAADPERGIVTGADGGAVVFAAVATELRQRMMR